MCGCVPVLKPFFLRIVPKGLTEKSWSFSFGKTKNSWNGDTLKGDTQYSHKSYIELEHGKVRSQNTSVSTAAGQPHWPGHVHGQPMGFEPKHHGDELEDRKYINPV